MTTTLRTKSIATAVVAGALAIAAPAGASVLEPVTAGWNPGGTDVQTVNATVPPNSEPTVPVVQTVNAATSHPADENAPVQSVVPLRSMQSLSFAGTTPGTSGDGIDLGYVAIGAGGLLLIVSLAMFGSSAINGRRESRSKAGPAISQAA
jgi:hypothetical protein